jgi:hypothetical protein
VLELQRAPEHTLLFDPAAVHGNSDRAEFAELSTQPYRLQMLLPQKQLGSWWMS